MVRTASDGGENQKTASLLTLLHCPGVTAPIASITLVRTVSFSIYQRSKYVYADWLKRNLGVDVVANMNKRGTYPDLWSVACFGAAGATAGSGITLLACEILSSSLFFWFRSPV